MQVFRTLSWNGETITLKDSVVEQLRQNYYASKDITPKQSQAHTNKNPLPSLRDNRGSKGLPNPLANAGGSPDSNREHEINGSMDLAVDNEETQRMKWRR